MYIDIYTYKHICWSKDKRGSVRAEGMDAITCFCGYPIILKTSWTNSNPEKTISRLLKFWGKFPYALFIAYFIKFVDWASIKVNVSLFTKSSTLSFTPAFESYNVKFTNARFFATSQANTAKFWAETLMELEEKWAIRWRWWKYNTLFFILCF